MAWKHCFCVKQGQGICFLKSFEPRPVDRGGGGALGARAPSLKIEKIPLKFCNRSWVRQKIKKRQKAPPPPENFVFLNRFRIFAWPGRVDLGSLSPESIYRRCVFIAGAALSPEDFYCRAFIAGKHLSPRDLYHSAINPESIKFINISTSLHPA